MKKIFIKKISKIMLSIVALTSFSLINNSVFAQKDETKEQIKKSEQIEQKQPVDLNKSQAGFYYFKVGDIKVTALSDGTTVLNTSLLNNEHKHDFDKLLKDAYATNDIHASVNSYLIELKDKLILVDTGGGTFLSPTLNKLQESLKNSGYSAEKITDIVITHFHSDHIGGLINNERLAYPNATLHLNKKEVDYWLSQDLYNKASEKAKKNFENANKIITPYIKSGQVKLFEGKEGQGIKILDGLKAIPARGHTAGHTFYNIESKGEKLVFLGDTLHIPQIQFPQPDVTIEFDSDAKQAAIQRKNVFADASKNRYLVALAHVPFPGVGNLSKQNNGYKWVPIPYINNYIFTGK